MKHKVDLSKTYFHQRHLGEVEISGIMEVEADTLFAAENYVESLMGHELENCLQTIDPRIKWTSDEIELDEEFGIPKDANWEYLDFSFIVERQTSVDGLSTSVVAFR